MTESTPPPTSAYADVVDKLGTIAAPLLGGFSITLIGIVASNGAATTIRWPGWTLGALTAATVMFLVTVQFTIAGRQFLLTRAEHKERTPSVPDETREQAYTAAMDEYRAWATRARITFDLGLAALLLGLTGALLPPGKVSHFSAAHWCALVIAAAAFLGEVLWLMQDEWQTARWNDVIRDLEKRDLKKRT